MNKYGSPSITFINNKNDLVSLMLVVVGKCHKTLPVVLKVVSHCLLCNSPFVIRKGKSFPSSS